MERARRAPQYSIVMNNVILGSSPVFETSGNAKYPTDVSSPADVVTDGTRSYYGYVATTVVKNNFMAFDYSEIMPEAYVFVYDITDEGWARIEDTTDPAATVEPIVVPILKKLMEGIYSVSDITVGPTFPSFDPLDYFYEVYGDFDWNDAEKNGFYWLDEIK